VSELTDRAATLAESYLANALPTRWQHVQAVAAKASRLATHMSPEDGDAVVAAAWLHDVGYSSVVADTGPHALDGARQLLRDGMPPRVAALVAHHSCAAFEASERGLSGQLTAEFPNEESAVTDALWYADMTTGPDGRTLTVFDRLAEIRSRYGPEHLVSRFWDRAQPTLAAAVERVEERMGTQPM
jgi:putative nucleotidyltransferase with HDIG domain